MSLITDGDNSNLLYPPDMAEESSQFMKNACIMDFCIHSNTLTSGTWCPNSFHILASLTIREIRYTFFETKKKEDNL